MSQILIRLQSRIGNLLGYTSSNVDEGPLFAKTHPRAQHGNHTDDLAHKCLLGKHAGHLNTSHDCSHLGYSTALCALTYELDTRLSNGCEEDTREYPYKIGLSFPQLGRINHEN